ncbi:glycosyltransferase [Polaribacter sp. M15]
MKKIIYVLHERSTKEHFTALETYASAKNLEVRYREFLILRYFVKSIVRLDIGLFKQQVKNCIFFANLIVSKKKNIIFGIAPLDYYLLFLRFFLKNHNVFYFTSWGNWSGGFFPKQKFSNTKYVKIAWANFLKNELKAIFAVTKVTAKSIEEHYRLSCPIVVVNHAIDNSITIKKKQIDNKVSNKTNLIFVGRFVEDKGIYELLDLMQNLDREKYSLKIIGDGPLKEKVLEASNSFSNIEYLGYISSKKELFDLFSKSDVQLLFSKKPKDNTWEELFGIVIIEAMYCGIPTISTSHIGPKSIINNGINGFLIDENNIVEESLKILKEKLYNNKEIIANTQVTAHKFYKNNLSKKWAEILDNYI